MTPDEQIAVIRARAEGKKIEWNHNGFNHLPDSLWHEMLTDRDFDFQYFDYRIAPSPIASGHNPDKLTVEQVGEGWRLLAEEEISDRKWTYAIQVWEPKHCRWSKAMRKGADPNMTFRTQKPEGYFLPKKVVKVEGWINVYEGGKCGGISYKRKAADENAHHTRIACKHIVFDVIEGEGL